MQYTLYYACNADAYQIKYSPDISFDACYLATDGYHVFPLAKPLPLGIVHAIQTRLTKNGANKITGWAKGLWQKIVAVDKGLDYNRAKRLTDKILTRMRLQEHRLNAGTEPVPVWSGRWPVWDSQALEILLKTITGRILQKAEIERSLAENGINNFTGLDLSLHYLYLQGKIDILPGVGYTGPGELQCFRCGSKTGVVPAACACSNQACYYCEDCIMLGAARFCEPLYRGGVEQTIPETYAAEPVLRCRGLSAAQEMAAARLEDFVKDKFRQICLVEAVCGAGKTEVAFRGIAQALKEEARVLYAAPRRDVITELYPRFVEAFPGVTITALYGGSPTKYGEAAITLATTHQLMRFAGKFDIVFLDEADAYPYRENSVLRGVLQRALKEGSKIIYITATPDPFLYRQVRDRHATKILLPARYHGYRLPVPEILKSYIIRNGQMDPVLVDWLFERGIRKQAKVFIFVPHVSDTLVVYDILRQYFADDKCACAVHAADPERDRKKLAFQKGPVPFLVTTTIMERGITVPNAHVLVLWADNERIFTEGALIQMAGRAGRTVDYPAGDVLYAAATVSEPMEAAIKKIIGTNSLAGQRGLLR